MRIVSCNKGIGRSGVAVSCWCSMVGPGWGDRTHPGMLPHQPYLVTLGPLKHIGLAGDEVHHTPAAVPYMHVRVLLPRASGASSPSAQLPWGSTVVALPHSPTLRHARTCLQTNEQLRHTHLWCSSSPRGICTAAALSLSFSRAAAIARHGLAPCIDHGPKTTVCEVIMGGRPRAALYREEDPHPSSFGLPALP